MFNEYWEYLPDWDEIQEEKLEFFIESRSGADNMYCCPGCDKWINLDDAVPASSSPYATPICRDCAG